MAVVGKHKKRPESRLDAVAFVEFYPYRTGTNVGRPKTTSIGAKIGRGFFDKQNRLISKSPFDFAHIRCRAGQAKKVVPTLSSLVEDIIT
jgi:hypothetical protein